MDAPAGGRIAYPGLRAFKREEFDIFFGRENCVDQMVDILAATRFLAVLGTSGSGKSSLVKTGLLNALELGYFPGAGSNWKIADFRPRGRPIRSLAEALLGLRDGPPPKDHEIEMLAAFLRRGPKSLVEWCQDGNLPQGWNLVLIADQFEELFRYEDYSGRQDAEAFVALLIESAADKSVPVHVVITMRSEYLRQCTLIEGLPEAINRGLYLAPRMTREECRQAIVGPAAVCGFSLEPALVNRLLNDLTDFAPWEAGAGYDQGNRLGQRADQLPLMQHVLNLLWQIASERHEGKVELKLADYEAVNGLGGALNRHADEIAGTIDPKHADVIDVVFRSLVAGKTAGDAIRRPTAFGNLVALAGGRRESVAAVVDAFRAPGRNFLVPDAAEPLKDDTIVDISHESLIRQWRRLSQCVVDEARSADVYQQLTSSAERFTAKRGGLLTGLDLANIAAWWRAENPTAAWAGRYGGHFDEAKTFLEESEAAEAERKRRDDEAQRQLIAGHEAALRSKQLQRLAYGLVAMLLLALCGAVATTVFYFSARSAQQQAIQAAAAEATQRQKAELAAAAEATQRQKAEKAAAEAKTAQDAEAKARKKAEQAEAAADDARKRSEDQVLKSISIFAGSLADRIDLIHRDVADGSYVPADLTLAGSFLSQVAHVLGAPNEAMASAAGILLDQLRPALAVQDWYSRRILPVDHYSGSESDGKSLVNLADARYQLLLYPDASGDASVGFLTVNDRLTGRVVAGYRIPTELREATAGVASDATAVLLLMPDGRVAVAGRGDVAFSLVPGLAGVARVDDIRHHGDSLYLLYRAQETGGERVAVLGRVADLWHVAQRGQGDIGAEAGSGRIAGFADGKVYSLVDHALLAIDTATGLAARLDVGAALADARVLGDGSHIVAALQGSCPDTARDGATPAGSGSLPRAFGNLSLSWKTVSAVTPAGQPAGAPVSAASPEVACLALLDASTGAGLWQGEVRNAHLATARAIDGGGMELIQGTAPDGLHVLKITMEGGKGRVAELPFLAADWSLGDFSSDYAEAVATGRVFSDALTAAELSAATAAGSLRQVVPPLGTAGSIIGRRIGENLVQVVNVSGKDGQSIAVLAYRHGATAIEPDNFLLRGDKEASYTLPCEVPELPKGTVPDPCRFLQAAFSPDGRTLLVVSNYRFMFLSSDGKRVSLDRTIKSAGAGTGPAVVPADAISAEGQDVPAEFVKLLPLDAVGDSFLGVAAGNKLWHITREKRSVGWRAAAAISVKPIAVPRSLETIIQEVYGDPASETIYLRTRRSIGMLTRGQDGAWNLRTPIVQPQDQPALVGLAPMPKERLALLLDDGTLSVRRRDGGTSADVPTAMAGVRNVDSMSARNDRIILDVPQASVGYALADGKLALEFIVPWQALDGQLATGEVVSVADGLQILAAPPAPKDDRKALTLAQMREDERVAGQGADFSLGFDILRQHALASSDEGSDDAQDFACEPALMIAIRSIDRGLAEGLLDAVTTACSSDQRRRQIVEEITAADAGGVEGNSGIVRLLRLANNDDLALGALVNTIKRSMPEAAAALVAFKPSLGLKPSGGAIEATADGGSLDLAAAAAAQASGLDPFDHWLLALAAERRGSAATDLTEALYHYALAERLLKAVGAPVPAHIRDRRIALSRILGEAAVLKTFAAVQAVSLSESPVTGQGASKTRTYDMSTLEAAAAWLAGIQATAADPKALNPLVALIEEAFGVQSRATDKVAAAQHFRKAIQLYVGSLEDARRLRDELIFVGDESADELAAGAILAVIDRNFTTPIAYDAEARGELTNALGVLAGAQGSDLGMDFSGLKFGFLDFDWSSLNRAAEDAARELLEELRVAENFFIVRIAAEPRNPWWYELRGRARFWMSQLNPKILPEATPERVRDWSAGALTDFEAAIRAGGKLELWDRFLLAEAYGSRADALAKAGSADWQQWANKAVATYGEVIDDPGFAGLDRSQGNRYRQRLVFNGLMVVLHQSARRLQGTEPLAGAQVLPTDPAYDRKKAVDLAYAALAFAAKREAVLADARQRDLIQGNSANWNVDRRSDYLWGYTVASLGAAARIVDGANGMPGTCDEMAAHASDVDRPSLPVGADRLDVDRILAECPETTPRNLYYRARALSQEDWDANAGEVTRLLLSAARQGVAIAYHNLSVALTTSRKVAGADERYQIADDLWSTYAELTLIKGYPEMSDWLRAEAATPGHAATMAWLAGKAARLGVPEAHRDLADDGAASPRDRAVHLKIAGRLFAAAGRGAEADAMAARVAALGLSAGDLASVEAEAGAWQEDKPAAISNDLERKILDLIAATKSASAY